MISIYVPETIRFASFLNYNANHSNEKLGTKSKNLRDSVKKDQALLVGPPGNVRKVPAINYISQRISECINEFPFLSEFLNKENALVPIPRSTPLKDSNSLWPSKRICEELLQLGLGCEVFPILERKFAIHKSSYQKSFKDRPKTKNHFESFQVDHESSLFLPTTLILVDDFITCGSTFFGAFHRLKEAVPNKNILCFALMRTRSRVDFDQLQEPVHGKITLYQTGNTSRNP